MNRELLGDETFTLRVQRDRNGRIDRIDVDVDGTDTRSAYLNGLKAGLISPRLWEILRTRGLTARRWTGTKPIELDQTTGAHAWLLLAALRPLRRSDRIDEVADGIEGMSREEACYWYAKASRSRGLRSLRLLLSNDERSR